MDNQALAAVCRKGSLCGRGGHGGPGRRRQARHGSGADGKGENEILGDGGRVWPQTRHHEQILDRIAKGGILCASITRREREEGDGGSYSYYEATDVPAALLNAFFVATRRAKGSQIRGAPTRPCGIDGAGRGGPDPKGSSRTRAEPRMEGEDKAHCCHALHRDASLEGAIKGACGTARALPRMPGAGRRPRRTLSWAGAAACA